MKLFSFLLTFYFYWSIFRPMTVLPTKILSSFCITSRFTLTCKFRVFSRERVPFSRKIYARLFARRLYILSVCPDSFLQTFLALQRRQTSVFLHILLPHKFQEPVAEPDPGVNYKHCCFPKRIWHIQLKNT